MDDTSAKKLISLWLISACLLVLAMVVVGGVTRLTNSGLSMVDWKPLLGIIPPLNQEQWLEVYGRYKLFPEYKLLNTQMTLDEFKFIFYWEYAHRLLGRAIGVVFAVPFLFFLSRRILSRRFILLFLGAFILGGLQGLMGWYMVKSGLIDVPHVSHYRLAAHLLLAFIIFAYLVWLLLLLHPKALFTRPHSPTTVAPTGWIPPLLILFVVQIIIGAFTAGKKAGYGFNTFPLMNNMLVPDGLLHLTPVWLNVLENNITIQFAHRWLGVFTCLYVIIAWLLVRKRTTQHSQNVGLNLLLVTTSIQFVLGIATLVLVIPITLAVLHQLVAALLVGVLVFVAFCFYYTPTSNDSSPR